MSFVGVQPIDVLRFDPAPGERAFVTLGMSRQPMTGTAERIRAVHGPRAELILHVRDPDGRCTEVWRRLAVLAAAPEVEGVVYAPGMSVDLGAPLAAGSACTGVVILESRLPAAVTEAGLVAILCAMPATATELAWCRVRGSPALRAHWTKAEADLLDLFRAPVRLD
jgi:hypothetical protein